MDRPDDNIKTFHEQSVIVTGAGRGIGHEIAMNLAKRGASVVVADYSEELAHATSELIQKMGGEAQAFTIDVAQEQQAMKLMDFTVDQYGPLSILVNNAGIGTFGLVEELEVVDWQRVIEVNLTGPFILSKLAVPIMRQRGGGKIVNIASVAGKRLSSTQAASYSASKAGLIAFTRHLAYEVAPFGINVNAVCPGPVDSPMTYKVSEEVIEARTASVPLGRLTSSQDQANAVMFLASDKASAINGVALDVDGGALLGWYDVATYYERRGFSLQDMQGGNS